MLAIGTCCIHDTPIQDSSSIIRITSVKISRYLAEGLEAAVSDIAGVGVPPIDGVGAASHD